MKIESMSVTVPFQGGSFTCLVPAPVAEELARLHESVRGQIDKRERSQDMVERLLTRLEKQAVDSSSGLG